jgi:hypothetical protein
MYAFVFGDRMTLSPYKRQIIKVITLALERDVDATSDTLATTVNREKILESVHACMTLRIADTVPSSMAETRHLCSVRITLMLRAQRHQNATIPSHIPSTLTLCLDRISYCIVLACIVPLCPVALPSCI